MNLENRFLEYEVRGDYVYFSVTGTHPGGMQAGLDQILNIAIEHRLSKILVDVRRWTGTPSTLDRYAFGQHMAERVNELRKTTELTDWRLAFVGNETVVKNRFGEMVALNRGIAMKVTTSPEEALAWLQSAGD